MSDLERQAQQFFIALGFGPKFELYMFMLRQAEPVNSKFVAEQLKLPHPTASRYINELTEVGLLLAHRSGRTVRYLACNNPRRIISTAIMFPLTPIEWINNE